MKDGLGTPGLGRVRRIHFATLLVLGSGALALVAVEGVLRLLAPGFDYLVWPPGLRLVFEPAPGLLPGVGSGNRFTINSWGIRGDEFTPEDDYRILALGGSTTECRYLDDSGAWPHRLQQRLNEDQDELDVWVGNIGRSGHSTRDHMLQMERLVVRYPRIDTVLLLVGANDLLLRLHRGDDYRPLWLESPRYRQRLVEHAFAESPARDRGGLRATRIGSALANAWSALDPAQRMPLGDRTASQVPALRKLRHDAVQSDELPDLSLALEEYRRNLAFIVEVARRHGIRPILMTQPTLWRPDLPYELDALLLMGGYGPSEAFAYLSLDALTRALAAYNAALRAFCAENSVECVDLVPLLPQDASVFYDDFHFNERGAERVANALAAELLRWPPFSRSAASP